MQVGDKVKQKPWTKSYEVQAIGPKHLVVDGCIYTNFQDFIVTERGGLRIGDKVKAPGYSVFQVLGFNDTQVLVGSGPGTLVYALDPSAVTKYTPFTVGQTVRNKVSGGEGVIRQLLCPQTAVIAVESTHQLDQWEAV